MKLKEYISTNFPGLVLKPSLYEQWDRSIQFEFAKGLYQLQTASDDLNPEYFSTVYYQAITLFNELFSAEDEILLVTNIYQHKDFIRKSKKKIKVYSSYNKNKDIRFHLKQETLPYMFDDEEDLDDKCTSQFVLTCRKKDIRFQQLIKAICNQDFPSLKPRVYNPYALYEPDVFFINVTKHMIYYIYDDRGCEVIAKDLETLHPLFNTYSEWVDEKCFEVIKKRFMKRVD